MFEGIFRNIKDMKDFTENLEERFKILEINSFFIMEDLKIECFMANPNLLFDDNTTN